MNPKWQALDLEGGGLQAMNLRLTRSLRRRRTAWLLLLLFPAGAHRWYLREAVAAIAYPSLTLGALAGWAAGLPWLQFTALAALAVLLVTDIASLENRIAAFNRRLRMASYLSPGAGAPAGFRGRTGDDPPVSPRVPGFAEQERLLRALAEKSGNAGGRKGQ